MNITDLSKNLPFTGRETYTRYVSTGTIVRKLEREGLVIKELVHGQKKSQKYIVITHLGENYLGGRL